MSCPIGSVCYDDGMRCFLAIELPDRIKQQLATLQQTLQAQTTGIRWVRSEQIHLTVKFLGEVADGLVPQVGQVIADVVSRHASFDLHVKNVGCFPSRGSARVAWVGLGDLPQTLVDLHKETETALTDLGFARENRPFKPHLTIGRINDPRTGYDIRRHIERRKDFEAGSFPVSELVLFQSVLQRTGPIHTPIARCPLTQS